MATHVVVPQIKFGKSDPDVILPQISPYHIAVCYMCKAYLHPTEVNDPTGSWSQRQALGDALLTSIRYTKLPRLPTIQEFAEQLQVG